MYKIDQSIAVPVENGVEVIKRSVKRINRSFEGLNSPSESTKRKHWRPTEEDSSIASVMQELNRIKSENKNLRKQIASTNSEMKEQQTPRRKLQIHTKEFSCGNNTMLNPSLTRSAATPGRARRRCQECLNLLSKGFSSSKCSEHGLTNFRVRARQIFHPS